MKPNSSPTLLHLSRVEVSPQLSTLLLMTTQPRKRPRATTDNDECAMTLRRLPHRCELPTPVVQFWEQQDKIYREKHGLPPATTRMTPPAPGITEARIRQICTEYPQILPARTVLSTFQRLDKCWSSSSVEQRWAHLWTLSAKDRMICFERIATEAQWKASTKCQYFEAIMQTGLALSDAHGPQMLPTAAEHRMLTLLRFAHSKAPQPPLVIVTPPEVELMRLKLEAKNMHASSTLLRATYCSLSRVPDVAGCLTTHVFRVNSACALLLNSTKTSAYIGPHTLHFDGALANDLEQLARTRKAQNEPQLFPHTAKRQLAAALPEGRSLLSVRKGAAVAASLAGTHTAQISAQMGHTNLRRTIYYLGGGLYNVEGQQRSIHLQHIIQVQMTTHR